MPPRAKKIVEEEIDPFAPDQDDMPDGDEAQTDLPPWEVEDNETDVKNTDDKPKENKTVVEFGGGERLSVTLKQRKGYEAAWLVLKGDAPADILSTMHDENFKKLLTGGDLKFMRETFGMEEKTEENAEDMSTEYAYDSKGFRFVMYKVGAKTVNALRFQEVKKPSAT